jgi:hypothetical protein
MAAHRGDDRAVAALGRRIDAVRGFRVMLNWTRWRGITSSAPLRCSRSRCRTLWFTCGANASARRRHRASTAARLATCTAPRVRHRARTGRCAVPALTCGDAAAAAADPVARRARTAVRPQPCTRARRPGCVRQARRAAHERPPTPSGRVICSVPMPSEASSSPSWPSSLSGPRRHRRGSAAPQALDEAGATLTLTDTSHPPHRAGGAPDKCYTLDAVALNAKR